MKTKLTFSNAPQEVISRLFQELDRDELFECQKVCRSWYSAAHRLFLKKVRLHLSNNSSIDSFLKVIDDNPSYADSFKQLELGSGRDGDEDCIDAEHAQQLFARVPGIKELYILDDDTFDNLVIDDEVRKSIIEAYPKLEKVYCNRLINAYSDMYYGYLIDDLQQSLTNINLMINSTHEFLSNFVNLQTLDITESINLFNCRAWAPLFDQQFTLKSLTCSLHDKDDSVDQFMASKTQGERDTIIQKLSKLEFLDVKYDSLFNPSSIKFIIQYMKGLKEFRLMNYNAENWSNIQRDIFCQDFMDYASCIENSNILIWHPNKSRMSTFIQAVLNKFFLQLPAGFQLTEQMLRLQIDYHDTHPSQNKLTINSTKTGAYQLERFVELQIGTDTEIVDSIATALTTNKITSFNFCFNRSCPTTYISTFQHILNQLSMVKKVSLEIQSKLDFDSDIKCFPEVVNLELDAKSEIGQAQTFSRCLSMFPGIRYLKLHRFSGIYKAHKKEFQIPLQSFKLERLYLDVSPIVTKTLEKMPVKYFILDIATDNDRHLYQVTVDYLRITKIKTEEVNDDTHIRVIIMVKDLEFINLCRFDNWYAKKLMESKLSLYQK